MTRLFRAALSRHIVKNSLKISLVVGIILNVINQGVNLSQGGNILWLHLLMNFLVPYCVASYSAAKNEIELRESNDCQLKPQEEHRPDRESAG